jgi:CHRD domain
MTRSTVRVAMLAGALLVGVSAAAAQAGGGDSSRTGLEGYQEVPAVSTAGEGTFRARLSSDGDSIQYRLKYDDLSAAPTQAHIHFGQFSVNGGIAVFLCSNLPGAPAGTQPCPAEGTVTGTITAANVGAGAAAQGLAAGEFDELVAAIEAGVAYVNVHSSTFPGGEIRGQLADDGDHD